MSVVTKEDVNIYGCNCTGFFAAMGKAGGGRNKVDPRFMSMFSVFNMTFPSDNTVRLANKLLK